MTLSELQAKRDKLLEALAKPRRLQAGDLGIEYNDPAAVQRAIAAIDAEIARLQNNEPRVFVVRNTRGLD